MANAVIGALRVVLGMDTAQFDKDAGKAQAKANAFGAALKTGFTIAAGAAAAAAGALGIAVKGAINEADDMSKAAAKLGIPIEELSQLRYAADLSGVSMDGLSTGVKKLSTMLADAKNGSKSAIDVLKQIGVTATDSSGNLKSSSVVMGEIADRFAAMPEGVEKSALAVKLFGKSGLDLIPMLNGGSAALREMMAEADALGLTLTAETGKAAEQFNDNLSRISYAGKGVVTQLTATLAPALAVISDGFVVAARATVGLLQYLPQIAEYAAVAGGALAVAFGPALLSAVGSATVAIGTGLVGAIRAVTVAVASNPLGAIALGIATAIVAIYHFRDEIKQAVGVDVVQVVKDAGNVIINSFRAAIEDIKFAWSSFPDIIGAAVIGAVNAVVSGVQTMIAKAVEMLNSFISTANGILSTIDIEIPQIPAPEFQGATLKNDYADRLSKAVFDRNKAISDIMASDPIGSVTTAISSSWSSASDATKSLTTDINALGTALDTTGGKAGGAGTKAEDPWEGLRKATKDTNKAMEDMQKTAEGMGQGIGSSFAEAIKGTKDWRDVALDALKSVLAAMVQNASFGGGFGGSLLKGLFGGLVGFANGGTILPGGSGGIDSQVVAFRKSPTEQVDIYDPSKSRASGGGTYAPVYNIDARGADAGAVARIERALKAVDSSVERRSVAAVNQHKTRGGLYGKTA
ncbi:phage tail tape measure protein [Ciceribacter ferrooxidans]|uniref:Uncharacterized protein n=1 Tax=Ciceribacter ferrooxidans TaxID=2509717 RepID=A0A4Q2SVG9_9HYPH|nr:phage tail tape measure protein [Ciceribacter ferrooxidans]RYC10076.1 hypothetical protein EUU22_18555 [Ciceribacter ferrooxidans]